MTEALRHRGVVSGDQCMKKVPMQTTNKYLTWMERIRRIVPILFWIGLIVLCLIYKDRITVESIVNYTPENPVLAAGIIIGLFAFKSITFFLFSGILYAVDGILFSLPAALLVNTIGTAVMASLPYWIGRSKGQNLLLQLCEKYPKLEMLRSIPNQNEFLISFLIRLLGCLPLDVVSMYLGASGICYNRYVLGSVLGLLPQMIAYTVMGMSSDDITSPAFVISLCCEIVLIAASGAMLLVWRKRRKRHQQD